MSSPATDVVTPGPARVVEVSEDLYAYIQPDGSWFINNTGFLVGQRGVTSIDSCSTERRTSAYLEAIGRVTDQPVRTLVNTHHHSDHTNGNYRFSGASIVSHERCREEMLAMGLLTNVGIWEDVEWGALEFSPPFVTYTEGVTVWVDDLRCEVRHVGRPAHTTNDSIVWIPERSLLFAGDLLFNGGTPFVLMGSVSGSIEVLEQVVRPLDAGTIVPGHGPVAGSALIDDVVAYLRFVQETAEAGRRAGLSPLETARETDLGDFAGLHDAERLVGNLYRAFAELDGTPLGGGVDVISALADMVAFNGGHPLTCRA
jgi:cyclase